MAPARRTSSTPVHSPARPILLALAALVVAVVPVGSPAWAQTAVAVVDQGLPVPEGAGSVDFAFVTNVVNIATGAPDPHPFTTVQVGFTTVDGASADCAPFACAKIGKDYVPTNGVLTFPPGVTRQEIHVQVLRRESRKTNEVFFVLLLTPTNAIFRDPFGLGRITRQVPPKGTPSDQAALEFSQGFCGHPGGMVISNQDHNFWMTEQFDGRLVTFDPVTKTPTEYPPIPPGIPCGESPNPGFLPGTWPPPLPPFALVHFITNGPDIIDNVTPGDSNLWFTTLDDQVGTFDVETKQFRMFRLVESGIHPFSVPHFILKLRSEATPQCVDDGFFYLTFENEELFPEPGGQNKTRTGPGRLARIMINPPNLIQDFPNALPPDRRIGNRMHGAVVDANCNIWAGLEGFDEIWRFNRTTLQFEGPPIHLPPGSGPHDLVLGPDNFIYVVSQDANQIDRFNPLTGAVEVFDVPGLTPEDGPSLVFLSPGPEHPPTSLWFSEFLNDRVGRFDLVTHRFTEFYKGVSGGSAPIGIVTGLDGDIWFTEAVPDSAHFTGRIGCLQFSGTTCVP